MLMILRADYGFHPIFKAYSRIKSKHYDLLTPFFPGRILFCYLSWNLHTMLWVKKGKYARDVRTRGDIRAVEGDLDVRCEDKGGYWGCGRGP